VLAWLSVWSEVQMIRIWSSWCHCHPIIFCFIKIQAGLTFLVPAYSGCPGKGPLNRRLSGNHVIRVSNDWLRSEYCNVNVGSVSRLQQVRRATCATALCAQMQATSTERVQALADSLHSALRCHSNETHAPIANPPNSAQPTTIAPTYIRVRVVVWQCGKGQTYRRQWPIYISPRLRLTWNVISGSHHVAVKYTRELTRNAYNMKASAGIDAVVKVSPNHNTGCHQSLSMVQSNSTRARAMTKSLQWHRITNSLSPAPPVASPLTNVHSIYLFKKNF